MVTTNGSKKVRLIAFYLPQFHPIPENDEWWGKGFTEWTNVVKARPQFPGHYQPHLPADLGFYDLRLAEARIAQAELARDYGIYGFCYYHYWFNGKRLLERPFAEVLASGEPDFPFCLCWANENWTRKWDGNDDQILIGQHYSNEDDRSHLRSLAEAFRDPRYIRVNGKPLFLVYRARRIPDPRKTTGVWREEARRLGLGDLFLCRVESFPDERGDPSEVGFDASVEFQPDWGNMGAPLGNGRKTSVANKLRLAKVLGMDNAAYRNNDVYDYPTFLEKVLKKQGVGYKRFPCVTPSWDNSARRSSGAIILRDATPEAYEKWLRRVVSEFVPSGPDEDLIFINAWNEWAEGSHLEPCQRWGRAYLEATRRALAEAGEL